MKKPMSIETALLYGGADQFYNVIEPEKEDHGNEEAEIVGMHVINI